MSLLALVAAAQAALTPALAAPTTAANWAAAARSDIEAGTALMRDNHPGWVNTADPDFRAKLDRARKAGLAAAARASSRQGYTAALAAFSSELGDGHALLRAEGQGSAGQTRWPGFLAAWRGDALYVVDGEAGRGLGAGSRVLSCDGVGARALIQRRLAPMGVRLGEEGAWWAYASRVLTDASNVSGPAPRHCLVRPARGGAARRVTLAYRDAPADWMQRYWTAANGGYTDIGLTLPRRNIHLIGLPTFQPGDSGVAMYDKLGQDIAAAHPVLEKDRAIVIDLRFNQGGSSRWSRGVAEGLWGKEAVSSRWDAKFRKVEIWWRNSIANADHLGVIANFLGERGDVAAQKEYAAFGDRMRERLKAGEAFTVEEAADLSKPVPAPAPSRLSTPVYVIVPGQCASACLDALDFFTLFDNTRLIGAPSSGDSLYMEVREQALPSGQGQAIIPVKVWMHRPRLGGQIYRPDIALRQADWSTGAFLDAIEADLSKRGATR